MLILAFFHPFYLIMAESDKDYNPNSDDNDSVDAVKINPED
jgi:hypothetical protein